jgi:hypothetical protein
MEGHNLGCGLVQYVHFSICPHSVVLKNKDILIISYCVFHRAGLQFSGVWHCIILSAGGLPGITCQKTVIMMLLLLREPDISLLY